MSDQVQSHYESHEALGAEPTTPAAAGPVTVAFIGDSYTAGAGSTEGGWADRLASKMAWKATNLGLGGTGYVNTSGQSGCARDSCPNYPGVVPDVVKAGPQNVIVSGGRNDYLQSIGDVSQNATDLFQQLHAQLPNAKLIAFSPVWDATRPPAALAKIAAAVNGAVTAVGGSYVDMGEPLVGHQDLLAPDKVHPNNQGHEALAVAAVTALRTNGLAP